VHRSLTSRSQTRVASALSPSEDPAFTSRLQLAFKLVEKSPVCAVGDDLHAASGLSIAAPADTKLLMQPE
jgi:hypothetical protein